MDMFEMQSEEQKQRDAPLAARMRPSTFDNFVGQEHLIGRDRLLRKAIESGQLPSIIFWGPPGSGKTTLAYIIANTTQSHFSSISAVSSGVADLRRIIEEAKRQRQLYQQKTIVFIDEIHRFNKVQQDAILPFIEDGTVTLIGATTENPSFEVISPLLSRSRVLTLNPLSEKELSIILRRALKDKARGLGKLNVVVAEDAFEYIITMSNNDARVTLNTIELASVTTPPSNDGKRYITINIVEDALQRRILNYDKQGEQHYDIISALHKSLRGSDPDAALYWLARMIEAGEDPMYIARRLAVAASEDVGLADPIALVVAMSAQQAVHFIGMPEAYLALAEAVVYLATAPKSNSVYRAYSLVTKELHEGLNEPVPIHLRNPVTPLMSQLGYGKDYKYAHNYPERYVKQQYLPDSLKGTLFYHPSNQGYEKQIMERLKTWGKAEPQE